MSRLLIVTPCRDEIEFARVTLDSIVNQSLRPDLWIIVDDGSTDGTSEILHEYAEQYPFIKVVKRRTTRRNVGPGVVDAFYEGLESVEFKEFKYICKLDLDLDIPESYFATAINLMENHRRIGTVSGKPYAKRNGTLVMEPTGDDFSVGMIKLYRCDAFLAIGGFVRQVMWDGIDCHMCRFKGFEAYSIDLPALRFLHLRPMGSSQKNIYVGKVRHGFGQYYMGSSFLYFFVSCVFRIREYPVFLGAACSLYGYLKSWVRQADQFSEPGFGRYLKKYQMYVLRYGRAKAMEKAIDRGFHE